ncbi:MAG: YCF48-related protein [Saprospiraceae bacterium]|nr:YCF48-related protein [Saprospiraceae bacterium]MDZ4706270.1 YCF48-related protein [Saprospiraceae bacterium]
MAFTPSTFDETLNYLQGENEIRGTAIDLSITSLASPVILFNIRTTAPVSPYAGGEAAFTFDYARAQYTHSSTPYCCSVATEGGEVEIENYPSPCVDEAFPTLTVNGWICGYYLPITLDIGFLLKTEDGGENWSLNVEDTNGTGVFRTIQFIDENTGWASGSDNQIFKTTSGGDNWTSIVVDPKFGDEDVPLLIFSHFFVNDTLGWLSCLPLNETYSNLIYITLDGGATWRQQSIERDSTVEKIYMTSPTTGYAVTRLGRVLRYEAHPAECGTLPIYPTASSENIPPSTPAALASCARRH